VHDRRCHESAPQGRKTSTARRNAPGEMTAIEKLARAHRNRRSAVTCSPKISRFRCRRSTTAAPGNWKVRLLLRHAGALRYWASRSVLLVLAGAASVKKRRCPPADSGKETGPGRCKAAAAADVWPGLSCRRAARKQAGDGAQERINGPDQVEPAAAGVTADLGFTSRKKSR